MEDVSQVSIFSAKRLRERRQRRGWRPAQLAEKAGVRPQVIYRIERGIAVMPRELEAVVQALGADE